MTGEHAFHRTFHGTCGECQCEAQKRAHDHIVASVKAHDRYASRMSLSAKRVSALL